MGEHTAVKLAEALSIATGAYLVVSGIRNQVERRRRLALQGPTELRWLARSFRRIVLGLALTGVGAGLMADIPWLVTLSLIIGGQEVLESSVIAAALGDEEKRRAREGGSRAAHADRSGGSDSLRARHTSPATDFRTFF